MRRALPLAAVLLILAACASAPVERSSDEKALYVLQQSTVLYEETRQAVQRAYLDGTITQTQYDAIGPYGRAAEKALRTAIATLATGAPPWGELDALRYAVAGLVERWQEVSHE